MNIDEIIEPFQPQSALRVLRLTNDWEKIIKSLPLFDVAATVYRCGHGLHCIKGMSNALKVVSQRAFYTQGFRGFSTDLECWSEAWFYHEERYGHLYPCIEIADHLGQGLLKLCFREISLSESDENCLKELFVEEADEWSILHLHPSNMIDNTDALHMSRKTIFNSVIREIQMESMQLDAEVGVILRSKNQSSWDSLHATDLSLEGWVGFGKNGDYITLLPNEYQDAEVISHSGRSIANFYNESGCSSLSIIEINSRKLETMQKLERFLASDNYKGNY
ncbi:MAG: hypothetical protein ACI9E1_000892 [Cryomorphaceae bacterium]|jgi:hypothetical protein